MKRFVGLLLMTILLMVVFSAFADTWEVDYFLDDFGDKTDCWYIRTDTMGTYNYSNSSSGIKAFVVFSDTTAYFTLYDVVNLQYLGSKLVNNSSVTKAYEIMVRTVKGETSSFTAQMAARSDKIEILNTEEAIALAKVINSGEETRVVIKPKGSSIEKYTFTIERDDFLKKLPSDSYLKSQVDNRRYAFIDKAGRIIGVCNAWDTVSQPSEGLARVKKERKWGFVDLTGNLVIPCEWDSAWEFSEGLAAVNRYGRVGFINTNGELVIPCEWQINTYFSTGFCDGLMLVTKHQKYGFINKDGELIIPYEWDYAEAFSGGLAVVERDGKAGFIDTTGKLAIPCEWDYAGAFSEGLAAVEQEGKMGYIDTSGKLVIPCKWKLASNFSDGMAQVIDNNYNTGYIDQTGKQIIPCEYDYVPGAYFNDGLVKIKRDGKFGFIDKTGKLVIPCSWETQYAFMGENIGTGFSEGLAYVVRENKGGYINQSGEVVIPCVWELGSDFKDGIALVFGSVE